MRTLWSKTNRTLTEEALLLGCDESKLECLHVNKKSNRNEKKRKRKNENKLAMSH